MTSPTKQSNAEASPTPRADNRWWWRGVAVVGAICVVLLIAELSVRLLGLGPPIYAPRRFEPNGAIPFIKIPNGPIAYRPNTTFASVYDPAGDTRGYFGPKGRVTYQINRFGLRGSAVSVPKPAGTYRVVCLGDSLTFGEGVKYADTYPARLQARLAAAMPNRKVQVINAGVQTYNTADEAALYLLRCAQFRPDVVTLGFYLNDATDSRKTVQQHDEWTRAWKLSPLAHVSRLWEIFERARHARRLQDRFIATTRASFESSHWTECKTVLRGMRRVAREDGFRFVVVVFPVFWNLDGTYPFADIHEKIDAACRQADIECLDLLETFRRRPAESLWAHPTDRHPNEIAHRLAAERIGRYLLGAKE